jgi:hypothetical protein
MSTSDPNSLRRIKVINRAGIKPALVEDKPELRWIKLYKLRVNDAYQRSLAERSMTLIRKIISGFSWSKFHAPVVVQITPDTGTDDDTYEILDGQHTATAAASHGSIYEIPCLVVKASSLSDKAEAFVGLNSDKVRITPIQVFWAKVTAGQEDAIDVVAGMEKAGAKVIKRMPPYGDFQIGETLSVTTLLKLASNGGVPYVQRVMETAVRAELAPVTMDFIVAIDHLLLKKGHLKLDGEYDDLSWKIAHVIRRIGSEELLDAATKAKRIAGETLGYNLASVIKRELT